jgi:hypothetical protein
MPRATLKKQAEKQDKQQPGVSTRKKPPALASAVSGSISGAVISACVQVSQAAPDAFVVTPCNQVLSQQLPCSSMSGSS